MITVKDIVNKWEEQIPTSLAESWDKVGLQLGDLNQEVKGIVTTLDCTADAMEFAIEKGANLIISHHPFIFSPLQKIDVTTYQGRMIQKAIQHGITIYSAHTNLDIAQGGLNDYNAKILELKDVRGFVKRSSDTFYKLVVFVPKEQAESVRMALGNAGAGHIGNYSDCSFSVSGTGRFKPLEGTSPFIGQQGEIESVEEERIETIVPKELLHSTLKAMMEVHPYEEVAYDLYPVYGPKKEHYLGRTGSLPVLMNYEECFAYLQKVYPKAKLRAGGVKKERIQRIALCTGSGSEFMEEAARLGVDAYITGDCKYHDMQRARELNLLVFDAGHFGTESCASLCIANILESNDSIKQEKIMVYPFVEQEDFFF